MSEKKIYRTIIRFEILSEEPIPGGVSLSVIDEETTSGSWSGRNLDDEITNEELSGAQAVAATKAQGSDPSFFFMDEAGDDLEDEDEQD